MTGNFTVKEIIPKDDYQGCANISTKLVVKTEVHEIWKRLSHKFIWLDAGITRWNCVTDIMQVKIDHSSFSSLNPFPYPSILSSYQQTLEFCSSTELFYTKQNV